MPPKNIQIRATAEKDYLLLEAEGVYTLDGFKFMLDEVKALAEKYEREKLLIDLLSVSGLYAEEIDRYHIGAYMARYLPPPLKLAIVQAEEDTNYFGESVAINRGADLKVFFDREPAVLWLL